MRPLRVVISIKMLPRADTDLFTLDCGHEIQRRHRTIAPMRARCAACAAEASA